MLFAAGFVASTLQGIPPRRSPLWMEISPFQPKGKPIWPAQPLVTDVLHAWQLRKHSFSPCPSCDGSVPWCHSLCLASGLTMEGGAVQGRAGRRTATDLWNTATKCEKWPHSRARICEQAQMCPSELRVPWAGGPRAAALPAACLKVRHSQLSALQRGGHGGGWEREVVKTGFLLLPPSAFVSSVQALGLFCFPR